MFFNTLKANHQKSYNLEIDLNQVKTSTSTIKINHLQSYYIKGAYGTGKTTLALQIAKNWIKEGSQVLGAEMANDMPKMIHFGDLADLIIKAFVKDDTRALHEYNQLKNAKLLVIDDFGRGLSTDFRMHYLDRFIEDRCQDLLQTIFTSNKNLGDLDDEQFGAIRSRIFEMCGTKNIIELSELEHRINESGKGVTAFEAFKPKEIREIEHVQVNPLVFKSEQEFWQEVQNIESQGKVAEFNSLNLEHMKLNKWNPINIIVPENKIEVNSENFEKATKSIVKKFDYNDPEFQKQLEINRQKALQQLSV
jgi:DNA replication protein DnaC